MPTNNPAENAGLRGPYVRGGRCRRIRPCLVGQQGLPRHESLAGVFAKDGRAQFRLGPGDGAAGGRLVQVAPQFGPLDERPPLGVFAVVGARLWFVGLGNGGRPPARLDRGVFRRQRGHLCPLCVRRAVKPREFAERLPDLTQS